MLPPHRDESEPLLTAEEQRLSLGPGDLLAVLFLVAAVTAVLCNALHDPWRAVQEDLALQWQGLHAAANEQIQHGRFPHWNPYALGGERLFANVSLGLFYPGSALFRILPFPTALVWTWLFHYALTALAVYALARTVLNVLRPAAVAGALGFALGGFSLGHANHINFVMAMPYLPLLLLAVFQCSSRIRGPGLMWWWLLGVFSLASIVLSGGIPTLSLALVALAWLIGVLTWQALARRTGKTAVRVIAATITMGLAALGLAACQVLPTLDLYAASARSDYSQAGTTTGEMPWQTLLCQLVAPGVLASPTISESLWANHETYFFVGGVLTTFAVLGLLSFGRHTWGPGLVILLALSLALALGWPPLLNALDKIAPSLRVHVVARYIGLVHFAVVLLAATGIDAWLRSPQRIRPALSGGIGIAVSVLMWASCVAVVRHYQPAGFRPHSPAMIPVAVWSLAGVAVFIASMLVRSRRQNAAVGIVCVWSAMEFLAWSGCTWADQERSPYAPERATPIISFLQENLGSHRYFNAAGYRPLLENRGAVYGLENVEGYVTSKLNETREQQAFRLRLRGQPQALSLLSAKYILLPEGQPTGPYTPVFRADGVVVCENKAAMERAFFLGGIRCVGSIREALNVMSNAAFAPSSTGLLVDTGQPQELRSPSPKGDEQCDIKRWEAGEIEIDVKCETKRWVLIGTSFDPGWRAMIDDQPARLHRTDVYLTSMEVPPGRHSVRLSYVTPRLCAGVAVSALTAIGLVSAVCAQAFRTAARRCRIPGLP